MKKLTPSDRAVLFQYALNIGLPKWTTGKEVEIFAKITGESVEWAQAAYDKAEKLGYIDKVKAVTA